MFGPTRGVASPHSNRTKTHPSPRAVPAWLAATLLTLTVTSSLPALAETSSASPLALSEALTLAVTQSPRLAAQRFALDAAEETVVPASQLPDPKLALGIDNLPVDGPDRWSLTRDFMTMRRIGFMQDFPRAEKRRHQGERAQAEADKERVTLSAQSLEVKRDVALAWLEAWSAQAQVQTLTELVPEAELLKEVTRAQLAGGKAGTADPITARAAAVTLQDRVAEARRNLKQAQAMLARWVGAAEAARPLATAPDFTVLSHHPEALLAGVEHHPELALYGPMAAMARAEADLARAAKHPDWSLEVAYQQRGAAYSNMVSMAVRIDLPLWGEKRQDPMIRAREKQLERVEASREDARRMHEAEIRADLATWETAKDRVERIEQQRLPLSRERTAATLAAYRGGRGDLNAVLQARSNEIETRLLAIQQQAELGRAWARLNFLLDAHSSESK